jgi:hypothetical protein
MRWFSQVVVAAVFIGASGGAGAQELIPERRAVVSQDEDLPGGDIASVFDTTVEACERAALTNPQSTAYVFNTRNGSCFVKAGPGEGVFFQGAMAARIVTADPDRGRGAAGGAGLRAGLGCAGGL